MTMLQLPSKLAATLFNVATGQTDHFAEQPAHATWYRPVYLRLLCGLLSSVFACMPLNSACARMCPVLPRV